MWLHSPAQRPTHEFLDDRPVRPENKQPHPATQPVVGTKTSMHLWLAPWSLHSTCPPNLLFPSQEATPCPQQCGGPLGSTDTLEQ